MVGDPNPAHMGLYCRELLPEILAEACGVAADEAEAVAEDVMRRAEALAHLDYESQETVAAPFFEEAFDHEPADASLWMKAITTVVVRNSLLEELHTRGPVNSGGIQAITESGLAPLSHFRAARARQSVRPAVADDAFGGLDERYPRAWACLGGLRGLLVEGGGRLGYRPPDAPIPDLPGPEEAVEAPNATSLESPSGSFRPVVFSGIDPRFDQESYRYLQAAMEGPGFVLGLSALSRISRNSGKLLRVLEFLLARKAKVLTTNYLLADGEVYVRRNELVKPNSSDMLSGLKISEGLSGAHRRLAETYIKTIDERP